MTDYVHSQDPLSVLDCNRDSIREYTSCYEILCYHMLSLLVIFILSELMFIWVYFWSSSNITYSSSSLQVFQTTQDIRTSQTQDPNALTSTNTVLLSFSGILLGCAYHIRATHTLYHSPYVLCIILSHLFVATQIKEFQDLNFYLNECSISSVFFILIGLHFFHVGVGIVLLLLFLIWDAQLTRSILNFINTQLRLTQHHILYSLQLVYWHFVELLWLLIYYVLYH
jgi:heme/copper-type cytochrome/quinol oxidase subunit 3